MKKIILILSSIFIITTTFAQKITEKKGQFGMEVNGKTVLKNKYESVKTVEMFYNCSEEERLVAVKQNGKWGFFNLKGKEIIPIKYESCYLSFYSRLTGVKLNGKWGFINIKGEEVIPFKYDDTKNFSQFGNSNYVGVKINDKWGFINEKGKEVIPFKYDDVVPFPRGFASTSVKLEGKWGYIDERGQMYIDAKYDEAFSFIGDKARVKENGRGFYITYSGTEVESSTTNYDSNSGNNSSNNNNTSPSNKSNQKANNTKKEAPSKTNTFKCSKCGQTTTKSDSGSPPGGKCPAHVRGSGSSTSHTWKKS